MTEVRRIDATDGSGVAEAGRLLHDFNTEFDTPTPDADVLAARLTDIIGDGLFVVLAGDPAIGLAVVSVRPNVSFDGPVALLDELYVAPPHRGQGVGARLIAAVREECVRRGVEHIEINVDESDVDAQRFYEREGFTMIDPDSGERAFYWSGPSSTSTS